MMIKVLTTTTWLQQQLSGKSVQLAHLHLVPGPNMWARVNLRFEVEVFAGFANSSKNLHCKSSHLANWTVSLLRATTLWAGPNLKMMITQTVRRTIRECHVHRSNQAESVLCQRLWTIPAARAVSMIAFSMSDLSRSFVLMQTNDILNFFQLTIFWDFT